MRIHCFAAALVFSALSAVALPAAAQPLSPSPALSDSLVEAVSGCHRGVQRHYVPEFGRRAWHYHRGSNCRPMRVDGPQSGQRPDRPVDCHRDARRHFLRDYGRPVLHRHVGEDCRARIIRRSGG